MNKSPDFQLSPGKGCGFSILLAILWLIGSIGIDVLFLSFLHYDGDYCISHSLAQFIYVFIFVIITWSMLKHPAPFKISGVAWNSRAIPDFLYGTFGGAGGVMLGILLISIPFSVEITTGSGYPLADNVHPITWPYAFLMFAVYAANEEILCRGFLYPLLKKSTGMISGIILSSLFFTLLHIFNPEFGLLPSVEIFLAGVLLCIMRDITGNLYLAWGVHYGWNISQVGLGMPVSGTFVPLAPFAVTTSLTGPEFYTGGLFGIEGGIAGITATFSLIIIGLIILRRITRSRISVSTPDLPVPVENRPDY